MNFKLTKAETKQIEKYPRYSQDGKGKDAEITLKVFNPYGRGTWYILEAEKIGEGDYLFFGYVESPICEDYNEYGYFTLSELSKVKVPIKIQEVGTHRVKLLGYGNLEIDKWFRKGTKLGEVLKN